MISATVILAILLGRGIHRSLSAIRRDANQIESELDFTRRIEVVGNDEIAEMSRVFNLLLEKIASSMAVSVKQMNANISHVSSRAGETHDLACHLGESAAEGEQITDRTVSDINARSRPSIRLPRE